MVPARPESEGTTKLDSEVTEAKVLLAVSDTVLVSEPKDTSTAMEPTWFGVTTRKPLAELAEAKPVRPRLTALDTVTVLLSLSVTVETRPADSNVNGEALTVFSVLLWPAANPGKLTSETPRAVATTT